MNRQVEVIRRGAGRLEEEARRRVLTALKGVIASNELMMEDLVKGDVPNREHAADLLTAAVGIVEAVTSWTVARAMSDVAAKEIT